MKAQILTVLALAPVMAFSATGISFGGRDIFRIEVDNEPAVAETVILSQPDLSRENHRLRKRIARLERAVRQMQDRMFAMEVAPAVAIVPAKEVSCYLQTPFDGTVTGKGASEAEARGNTLKSCTDKGASFCDDSKVKCG